MNRHSVNQVHSFDTEMMLLEALAREKHITLCGPTNTCAGKPLPVASEVPVSKHQTFKALETGQAWRHGRKSKGEMSVLEQAGVAEDL